MKFSGEVRKVALEHLKKVKEINSRIDKLNAEKKNFRTAYFKEQMQTLTEEKSRVIREGEAIVKKMGNEYKERIHNEYLPKGEELTEDAALFSSAIAISHRQLEELADKYKDNNTMLQMIYQYSERNRIPLGKHGKTEAERASLADVMTNYYSSVVSRPEYSDIWEDDNNEANHFAE